MGVERKFLDWDRSLVDWAREFLLANAGRTVDLEKTLVVVPTRQAGRRLREALALECAKRSISLFPPLVTTPAFFLRPLDTEREAPALLTQAIWAETLCAADMKRLPALFPVATSEQDWNWALRMGVRIQALREALADGGLGLALVCEQRGDALQEPERWQDLAKLERAYLKRMETTGCLDPCSRKLNRAITPEQPEGIERIIVIATPDPTRLMILALERIAKSMPVEILVYAPATLADAFDAWGRPIPAVWRERRLDIPDVAVNLALTGGPADQARRVVDLAKGGAWGPADIAVGAPDSELTPYLAAAFEREDIRIYSPVGDPMSGHPLFQLLHDLFQLVRGGTFRDARCLFRNADMLAWLAGSDDGMDALLRDLDDFHSRHLPLRFDEVDRSLAGVSKTEYPALRAACDKCRPWSGMPPQIGGLVAYIRAFLEAVFAARRLVPKRADDDLFKAAAESVNTALVELEELELIRPQSKSADAFELFLVRLEKEAIALDRPEPSIEIEGWLELPWNDAPFLIVTGLNEGRVPEGPVSDCFLPDGLRKALGLRNDSDRMARDQYLMQSLIESRRKIGRVALLCGKTTAQGDVLKPSRLLFKCEDTDLPARVKILFAEPDEPRTTAPYGLSFRLQPAVDGMPDATLECLGASAFKAYLACPFFYYLERVLGMTAVDAWKRELDAAEFGTLLHQAWNRLAMNPDMRVCRDQVRITSFLLNEVDIAMHADHCECMSLPLELQLEAARERLRIAVPAHVAALNEDWEIVAAETAVNGTLDGIRITGRIDRVERNTRTGRMRILDYKTADSGILPDKEHLGPFRDGLPEYMRTTGSGSGRDRAWLDLQLPLYAAFYEPTVTGAPPEIGYFNMPRTADEAGIRIWEGFDRVRMDSALECARGVIADLRARRFWPPRSRVPKGKDNPMERLYVESPEACFDGRALESVACRAGGGA